MDALALSVARGPRGRRDGICEVGFDAPQLVDEAVLAGAGGAGNDQQDGIAAEQGVQNAASPLA